VSENEGFVPTLTLACQSFGCEEETRVTDALEEATWRCPEHISFSCAKPPPFRVGMKRPNTYTYKGLSMRQSRGLRYEVGKPLHLRSPVPPRVVHQV
jgi:hypothetical protein